MKCNRCGKETNIFTMSMFNTQEICMDCLKAERSHNDYQKAVDAERRSIMSGNSNYEGIGKPSDL